MRRGLTELPEEKSKTSVPMQWNQPPKKTVTPQPLRDLDIVKPAHGTELGDEDSGKRWKRAEFDPRSPDDRQLSATGVQSLLGSLAAKNLHSSGIFHFWDSQPDQQQQQQEQQQQPQQQMQKIPTDPVLDRCILVDLDALRLLSYPSSFPEPTEAEVEAFLRSLHVTEEERQKIEAATRDQAKSSLWYQLRKGRLTSSRFGDVLRCRGNPVSLLTQVMGYKDQPSLMPAAVRWGRDNEGKGREAYQLLQPNSSVTASGLHIHAEHSFLGASTDGKVLETAPDGTTSTGCLEIKCPFSVSSVSILDRTPEQLAHEYPDTFCLRIDPDGTIHLKKDHKYYDQVIGEIAVLGVEWCDFVVFTPAGVFVERINFDKPHWEERLLPSLKLYFHQNVVPELLYGKLWFSNFAEEPMDTSVENQGVGEVV